MGNESGGSKEPRYPRLEGRRNREVSYGEQPERADKERRHENHNSAFYLIEREAIRLRRLRWDLSDEARAESARIDEAATYAASFGAATRTKGHRAGPPPEPLAKYAREKDEPPLHADESVLARLQRQILWMFGRIKE